MKPTDESITTNKPSRRWPKRIGFWLLILLIPTLGLLIVALCCGVVGRYMIQERLNEALAELDRTDPGWRLADIEAARQQIPEEANSARVVVAASKLLPRKWPAPEFQERFAHLSPEEQLAPDDYARLIQELKNEQPALDEARKLAKMPRGRHPIAYKRDIISTLLPQMDHCRRVMPLLLHDAEQYDQRQEMKGALTSCRAALNAARSLGDEPVAVTQLVRIEGVVRACQGIERALAQGEPMVEDLEALRKLLADEDAFLVLPIVARGERAMCHELFDAIESGDLSFAEVQGHRIDWDERLFGFVYRDIIRVQHRRMLALMGRWIAIAQLPMPEQAEDEQLFYEEIQELRGSARTAALSLPVMPKMGFAARRKHGLIRCTIAAVAAERYRQTHKKWPDSLESLCPQFLAAVPLDPFDGKSLRYRRVEDGVIIYSVSSDKKDDDGNLDREHPMQPGVDIGVRLWDVAKRRQPPRPKAKQEDNLR